jgi:hypothetical protein
MKKLLLIGLLFTICFTACSPIKQTKKGNVKFTYNPKVWTIVEFTVEDSLRMDSLIRLNNEQKN